MLLPMEEASRSTTLRPLLGNRLDSQGSQVPPYPLSVQSHLTRTFRVYTLGAPLSPTTAPIPRVSTEPITQVFPSPLAHPHSPPPSCPFLSPRHMFYPAHLLLTPTLINLPPSPLFL